MELSELAAEVAALRERLDMEAGLRASQDSELADRGAQMRAQTLLIQAISLTQTEHTRTLRQLVEGQHRLDREVREVRATLAHLGSAMGDMAAMLQTLIDRA